MTSAVSGQDLVRELYAFTYTVDDSPALGCLAHVVNGTPAEVTTTARSLKSGTRRIRGPRRRWGSPRSTS